MNFYTFPRENNKGLLCLLLFSELKKKKKKIYVQLQCDRLFKTADYRTVARVPLRNPLYCTIVLLDLHIDSNRAAMLTCTSKKKKTKINKTKANTVPESVACFFLKPAPHYNWIIINRPMQEHFSFGSTEWRVCKACFLMAHWKNKWVTL